MLWKIILLFLCAMALIAMIGKALFPSKPDLARAKPRKAVTLCNDCGRPVVGKSCVCKGKS